MHYIRFAISALVSFALLWAQAAWAFAPIVQPVPTSNPALVQDFGKDLGSLLERIHNMAEEAGAPQGRTVNLADASHNAVVPAMTPHQEAVFQGQISDWASSSFSLAPATQKSAQFSRRDDSICNDYPLQSQCVAYCVVRKCQSKPNDRGCAAIRRKADRITGLDGFPCDAAPVEVTGNPILRLDSNVARGGTSTLFKFNSDLIAPDTVAAGATVRWQTDDGREATGDTAAFTSLSTGIRNITATATGKNGDTLASATATVFVLDQDGSIPGLSVPDVLGDADQDGVVTLADALFVKQYAAFNNFDLTLEGLRNADVDRDSSVTDVDAGLIAQMAITGTAVPKTLEAPTLVVPGTRVLLSTPALLGIEGDFEVEVGDSAPGDLFSVYPGYGSFSVPRDFANDPSAIDSYEVRVLENGTVVETFKLKVSPAEVAVASDPLAESYLFLDTLVELARGNAQATTQLADFAVDDPGDFEALTAVAVGELAEIETLVAEMKAIMALPGNEGLAFYFSYFANANGGAEFIAESQALIASGAVGQKDFLSPDQVCDVLVPGICAAKGFAKGIKTGLGVVGFICDGLLAAVVVAVAVPVDGPVLDVALLIAWASKCIAVEAKLKIIKIIGKIIEPIDVDVGIEASTTSPTEDENAVIEARLEVVGVDDLCTFGTGQAYGKFEDYLTDRIVNEMIRDTAGLRTINRVLTFAGGTLLNKFLETLQKYTKKAVAATGLGKALEGLANEICDVVFDTPGFGPLLPASRVVSIESGPGTLEQNSDGTADYVCPDPSETGSAVIKAEKKVCDGKTSSETVTVGCQTKPVTITMGDNGALNDDIYEVQIDGKSVLTSSSPVRSTSKTVDLPVGETTVTMLGRAAPDGIGTYFISFSGASVVGGDALSGSDLSVGVRKTFRINVQ